jgi:hypothetical protein
MCLSSGGLEWHGIEVEVSDLLIRKLQIQYQSLTSLLVTLRKSVYFDCQVLGQKRTHDGLWPRNL